MQHALIRAHPFATLVTWTPAGLEANSMPFLLDAAASPLGTLRAHLARANPHWSAIAPGQEALVVFQGVDSYVTPSWYASKREHGKVVPTWNYAMVQVWGKPRVIGITGLRALTRRRDSAPSRGPSRTRPSRSSPRRSRRSSASRSRIARIEGKWKASQNRPPADRAGVAAGLERQGDDASLAMARLVRERAQPSSGSSADKPSR